MSSNGPISTSLIKSEITNSEPPPEDDSLITNLKSVQQILTEIKHQNDGYVEPDIVDDDDEELCAELTTLHQIQLKLAAEKANKQAQEKLSVLAAVEVIRDLPGFRLKKFNKPGTT